MALLYPGWVIKVLEYQHLVSRGKYKHCFTVSTWPGALKGMLSELTFGGIWVGIPTYERKDNSDAVYQVNSLNTVNNARRLSGLPGSNRVELGKNDWLSVGYISGDMSTSGGLNKAISSANMRNLLTRNTFRIVTE